MSLLQAVTGLAADQGLPADKQAAMAAKLSRAAAELLQETWQEAEDEAAEGNKGTPSVWHRGASNSCRLPSSNYLLLIGKAWVVGWMLPAVLMPSWL